MDEIQEKKLEIRTNVLNAMEGLSEEDFTAKNNRIFNRIFGFANFLEAKIVLLHMDNINLEFAQQLVKQSLKDGKIVVLPAFDPTTFKMTLSKIDNVENDLCSGPRGLLEPDPDRCKQVPIECVDIAIIPGVAFDEKGGRIGSGQGYYDRFIPELPVTTRKVALAFEDQVLPLIPMESHDKHVDIVITEKRIIYKI